MRVGSGMGPLTIAPVLWAVSTISWAVRSRTSWSYASIRIRMRSLEKPANDPSLRYNALNLHKVGKYKPNDELGQCQGKNARVVPERPGRLVTWRFVYSRTSRVGLISCPSLGTPGEGRSEERRVGKECRSR